MDDANLKEIYWHGDSLDIIRGFPKSVRIDIGSELYLLQIGDKPLHSRPMTTVGRGVWEIRIRGNTGAYRVFYFVKLVRAFTSFTRFRKRPKEHRRPT